MSDSEKLKQLERLRNDTKHFGLRELELALPIIESLNDRVERDYYICMSAKWLALHGDLRDIDNALGLVRSTAISIEKHAALLAIASSYIREGDRQKGLGILGEAEITAIKIEEDDEYRDWQIAQVWFETANAYKNLGESILAKRNWDRSIKLAQKGQYSNDPQNAKECASILHELVKDLAQNGHRNDAFEVAKSIAVESWRSSAFNELRKNE